MPTVVDSDRRLGSSEKKAAVSSNLLTNVRKDSALGVRCEVNQHITDENDVHGWQTGPLFDQVQFLKCYQPPHFGLDLPVSTGALKVLHKKLSREAAINFELRVLGSLRAVDHLLREVGCYDLHIPVA